MLLKLFNYMFLKKKEPFVFRKYQDDIKEFSGIEEIGIYFHIPFCKSICSFCPYNKILHNEKLKDEYFEALRKEFQMHEGKLKKISSIYFGGGSPGSYSEEVIELVGWLRERTGFEGDVGIEVHPNEVDRELLDRLKASGINMLSIGVQSLNDDSLKILGRKYDSDKILQVLNLVGEYDFKCVDLDMMTGLPNQTYQELLEDIEAISKFDFNQLSLYPLIVFPMTKLYEDKKSGKYRFIDTRQEIKALDEINRITAKYGYERSSVWTYSKDRKNKYTSITREYYLGFGASASSYWGRNFYSNTFSVEEYIETLSKHELPINIYTKLSESEDMMFWMFWRFYEGQFEKESWNSTFSEEAVKGFKKWLRFFKFFGLIREDEKSYYLTSSGLVGYHFVEKYYSIKVLDKIWGECKKRPWIEVLKV